MNIITKLMTENDCYKAGRLLASVDYLIVHSTATPGVMAATWYDRWNRAGIEKCVHAFVDDTVVMQYLPWNWRGWQIGNSWGNSHSIGCEMCEDKDWTETYFRAALKNMIELYAYLAVKFGVPVNKIIGHYEAYQLQIGSNHGDPKHWWSKFNYTMDMFRADVQKEINRMDVIKYGMTGASVIKLQTDLASLGYNITADGSFGPATLAVVKTFQADNSLEIDGMAGPATQAKIAELIVAKQAPVVTPEPEPVVVEKIVEVIKEVEVVKEVIPAALLAETCVVYIEGMTFGEALAIRDKYPQAEITL